MRVLKILQTYYKILVPAKPILVFPVYFQTYSSTIHIRIPVARLSYTSLPNSNFFQVLVLVLVPVSYS